MAILQPFGTLSRFAACFTTRSVREVFFSVHCALISQCICTCMIIMLVSCAGVFRRQHTSSSRALNQPPGSPGKVARSAPGDQHNDHTSTNTLSGEYTTRGYWRLSFVLRTSENLGDGPVSG